MKKFSQYTFALLIGFLAWSCSDGDDSATDLDAPIITQLSIANSTNGSAQAHTGETLTVNFTLTDNIGLSQVRTDIHNAFDGHTHERVTGKVWEQNIIEELNGANFYEGNQTFTVPQDAIAGYYHLDVVSVDVAGNQSGDAVADFMVTNDSQASVSVAVPSIFATGEIEVEANGTLTLDFTVTDATTGDVGLEEIMITVESDEDHVHSGRITNGGGELLHIEHEELEGKTEHQVNQTFELAGLNLEVGERYKLEIVVKDKEGNYTISEGTLHVD